MKLEITAIWTTESGEYITSSNEYATSTINEGLIEKAEYDLSADAPSEEYVGEEIGEMELIAFIGKYEFDTFYFQFHSYAALEYLDYIINNDDEDALEKFHRLSKSSNNYLLDTDGIQLEVIFEDEDFETKTYKEDGIHIKSIYEDDGCILI